MQIIYPYQVRFLIQSLTTLAESFDGAEGPAWHTLASAAACLERLLRGEDPANVIDITACLKDLDAPNPGDRRCGKTLFIAVSMAITILEGHRLGLIVIRTEAPRPPRPPVWIGIDLAVGPDRTVFGDPRHA